jgi:hypothetical protein
MKNKPHITRLWLCNLARGGHTVGIYITAKRRVIARFSKIEDEGFQSLLTKMDLSQKWDGEQFELAGDPWPKEFVAQMKPFLAKEAK